MAAFKVIETQEQLDEVLGERLKRERETVRKEYEGFLSPTQAAEKYKGYLSEEEVKEKYKDYLTPDKANELRDQIKGYETDSAKTRIAHETGIGYEAIGFLRGKNEDEIRKSAEQLKALIGSSGAAPLADPEEDAKSTTNAALKNALKSLKGE